MIDSYTATSVIVGFLIIFGLILPIMDKIPKIKDIVSLRWTIVVIYSAMSVGVIIDFAHLDTSVRFAVICGGILLSALFLIVRSLEKAAVNKWRFPRTRVGIKKGNIQADLSVHPKLENSSILDPNQIEMDETISKVLDESSIPALNKHRK